MFWCSLQVKNVHICAIINPLWLSWSKNKNQPLLKSMCKRWQVKNRCMWGFGGMIKRPVHTDPHACKSLARLLASLFTILILTFQLLHLAITNRNYAFSFPFSKIRSVTWPWSQTVLLWELNISLLPSSRALVSISCLFPDKDQKYFVEANPCRGSDALFFVLASHSSSLWFFSLILTGYEIWNRRKSQSADR